MKRVALRQATLSFRLKARRKVWSVRLSSCGGSGRRAVRCGGRRGGRDAGPWIQKCGYKNVVTPHQLADLGHLGVDDGDERGVDVRERGRGELRLHEGADEQRAASDDVLLEEGEHELLDV